MLGELRCARVARQSRVPSRRPARCSTSGSARSRAKTGRSTGLNSTIEYEVDGATYRGWHYDIHRYNLDGGIPPGVASQAVLDRFDLYDPARDNRYPCWYDPANPRRRRARCADIAGGCGWCLPCRCPSWPSAPAGSLHAAALGQVGRTPRGDGAARPGARRSSAATAIGRAYPFVPAGADMTNSPGTRLRFRLPMAALARLGPVRHARACASFSNGVVAYFAVIAVKAPPCRPARLVADALRCPLRPGRFGHGHDVSAPTAACHRRRADACGDLRSPAPMPAASIGCSSRNRDG